LATLAAAGAAFAQQPTAERRAAVLEEVSACRTLTDSAERLACYDRAVVALDQAEQSGQLVVMDRAQVQEVKREAFGFNLGSLRFLERGDPDATELREVVFTVERASKAYDGKWTIYMENGQVWRQTDTNTLSRPPKQGSQAAIRSAALGSFFINVDGQKAIRAARVQ
jgi:hypothetical protein